VRAGRSAVALVLLAGATAAQEPPPAEVSRPELTLPALDVRGPEAERRVRIEEALRARAYDRAETLLVEAVEREPRSADLLRVLGGVLFLRGNSLGAAIAFKKAEVLTPLDERSRFTLAMAYVAMRRRDWARPELEKLAAAAPRTARYVYWTARLDYDDGLYAAAVDGFLRAIDLDRSFTRAHDNLGLSYEALGRFDEAIASYR
jgi:tetratricopeptide (TPR) repeat protein